MRLVYPLALLVVVPALPLVWTIARRGRRTVPPGQHRLATILRSIGVVLLTLALAQPLLITRSPQRTVVFLVDRSSSITDQARSAQDAYITAAVSAASARDVTGVAVFGRELRLDMALTATPRFDGLSTIVDETATDLGGALLAVAAVLPTAGSRRVVVLTDGVETTGSARAAARELAAAGIAVDILTIETGRSRDVLITRVEAPTTAREGEQVPVVITVQSTVSGPATVTVATGREEVAVPVDLQRGSNVVRVEVASGEPGVLRVRAEVAAAFDEVSQNNRAEAMVRVLGAPIVAVIEGRLGDGSDLVRALEAGGMQVALLAAIPGSAELLGYDGVVLVNHPAPSAAVADELAAFVEELGRGLVVVGGDQSYGPGGYEDTALEEILPVRSDPDDLIRRQPVAEVLVIDTSGSMADCHCGGGPRDAPEQGGVNKTDISRAGAGLAISALQPTDRVGVLAFTSGTRWALELDTVPAPDVAAAALNTLTPQGDTEISQALREALRVLKDAPEEIRHMVLFTDGWGDDADILSAAQDIAAEGITLSVLGTGEGTGETLRRVAALGGGQFYPGRDLDAVPEIFVEETLRVARPLIAEGSFLPALGAASQVTAGLVAAPPLRGYVLTRAKATAQVTLEVGPGDPLLATWQRGLGRATAWTSDATARWSTDWVSWTGYVGFWGRVVRDVLPAGRDTPPEVRLDGGTIRIRFDAAVPLDAVAIAHVRDAGGDVVSVPLQRSGESTFTGRVAVQEEGTYWVAVQVENTEGTLAGGSAGIVAGYADEFTFRDPDPSLATDVARVTGGRADPAPTAAYDPAPASGAAERELWPLLVAFALGLFLIDVALRRLVVAKGDLEVWKEAVRLTPKKAVEAIATPPLEPGDEPAAQQREVHDEEETFSKLLRRKRKT